MNERIEDLMREADDVEILVDEYFLDSDFLSDIDPRRVKVFAELMAKKFDDILLLQQLDCIGNHDRKSAELIEKIRDKTKTYFGVEE
jgi:hypothetical protein